MDVSVVIATYRFDRIEYVSEAVQSVLAQNIPPREVIVVFDEAAGLREALEQRIPSSVQIIPNYAERGLSEARNTGLHHAQGELVAFLDDDAVAEPDWLGLLTEHFHDPSVAGGGGHSIPVWLGDGHCPWWFPEELNWIVGCHFNAWAGEKRYVRNVIGNNMCFRREVLERLGGFEVRVGGPVSGDDTEICIRITIANPQYRFFHEPNALVYHKVPPARQTFSYLLSRSWDEGIGKAVIRGLHHHQTLSSETSYLHHLVGNVLPRKFLSVVRGKWQNSGQIVAILFSIGTVGISYVSKRAEERLSRVPAGQNT